MDRITADETLRSRFGDFQKMLEVCDETGNVLGHFLPAADSHRMPDSFSESPFTRAELEERFRTPGGKSLDEIWKGLTAK